MMIRTDFDVAVVGAGPGGCAAAKRCAEGGLKTVLIEKRKLPRNKVCTGMIMSKMAQTLVKEEFGDPPEEVLTTPSYVSGIEFHAPGAQTLTLEHMMPFAWRKDFDNWLNQVAQGAGAELWDKAKVHRIAEDDGYLLTIGRRQGAEHLRARFLIGADGTLSVVRKALFPKVKMLYQLSIRQCYGGSLDLNKEMVHYVVLPDFTILSINFKDDVFMLEMGPRPGQRGTSEIGQKGEAWLCTEHGLAPGTRPIWRDGCLEPNFVKRPFSGSFPLARGNALIVGNAVGLNKPFTGEGIGTAMKSGFIAGDSVIQATKTGRKAEDYYQPAVEDMVATLGTLYPEPGKLRDKAGKGMALFLKEVRRIFSDTILVL